MKALVIGGGGPTGPHIVRGLRDRGFSVTTLSRGAHPYDHGAGVEMLVGDPHFEEPLSAALVGRNFDATIATYGRLSVVAKVLAGRTGRLIAAGGFAAYRGWHSPAANFPAGLPLPTTERATLVTDPIENRFAAKIAAAEATLFTHHPSATVFRYPYVYGPRQVSPKEWSIVRRVLDGRRTMLLVSGGRALITHGYSEHIAHTLLLALDNEKVAAGKAYNCGDDQQFDQRQIVEIAARALGVELDIVSLPDTAAGRALATLKTTDHKLMDTSAIRVELGYRDLVPPADALLQTIRYYADHPLERGGSIELSMMDQFDYAAEDRAISAARQYRTALDAIAPEQVAFVHPYAHPKTPGLARDERGR
jgi:nucleoside-diphosphate-sugar epimerase